jgi:hypothetical protein
MAISIVHEVTHISFAWGAVIAVCLMWNYILSRLVPPESAGDARVRDEPEPRLHRILTWVCGIFMVGLICEGTFTMIYVLAKFGLRQ